MKRKVIQIGNSTQLISLPRKWTQERGIKKGDELEITIQGRKIMIESGESDKGEVAKIKFTTKDRFLARPIHTLYKMGYDEILVEFDDPEVIELLQEQAEQLLGLEIVDHKRNYCLMRNVAKAMESEFDPLLRRVFLIIQLMAEDSAEAILAGDYVKLDEIERREKQVDKLIFFCQRLLIKNGYKEPEKENFLYETTSLLESVADDYRRLCKYVVKSNLNVSKDAANIMKELNSVLDAYQKLFYQPTIDALVKFKKVTRKVRNEVRDRLLKPKVTDAFVLHYIYSINEKINDLTESIECRF